MIDLVSVLQQIGRPRDFSKERADYLANQEQSTRLDQLGNLRNLWQQGVPQKDVALQALAQYDPAGTTQGMFGVGVNPLAQARFEAQQADAQRLRDAEDFYNTTVFPKYEEIIADGDVSAEDSRMFSGLYSKYQSMGGKTKNPLETYWAGLKETSMANKRIQEGEMAKEKLLQFKEKFNRETKLWEEDQAKKIPESKRADWKMLYDMYKERSGRYIEAIEKAQQVINLAQKASYSSDIAIVFDFMKALDPRSVVREGEFNLAASIGGLYAKALGVAEKAKGDQFLSDPAREQIVSTVRVLLKEYRKAMRETNKHTTDLAKGQLLDPKTILYRDSIWENLNLE